MGLHNTLRIFIWLFTQAIANILTYNMFQRLNIEPADYMDVIYSLTEDWSRRTGGERKVRTIRNLEFGVSEQVLTENGICYMTNNYLAYNISTRYIW